MQEINLTLDDMITNHNMLLAFGLTLIAGLSTGIGSIIALLSKKTDTRFLSASLGLSAGVMIYVCQNL